MTTQPQPKERLFTQYQVFMIAILAILQFTIILDFMVLSPLGAILLEKLSITTSQFGLVVSAYAFSAGASGFLAAGFADKYDRKKILMFFYVGFIIGTVLCAIAPNYELLLAARIVTGIFGGVIGSISQAIISDLFKLEVRGRVMGFVQMAFAASQVLGLPIGLLLANSLGWHAPFWMIAIFGTFLGFVIMVYMKPINEHLKIQTENNAFQHLIKTISQVSYLRAFLATSILATGGFMLMPFGSTFGINNLGLTMEQLPTLYLATGISSILVGPFIGKMSDKIGKFTMFLIGSIISMLMIAVYTNLGVTPLWIITVINVLIFIGINARMISSGALMTAIPTPQDRGAFMSINASAAQVAGGIASYAAGAIVVQNKAGYLEHYDTLGYTVIGLMLIVIFMIYNINRHVMEKVAATSTLPKQDKIAIEVV
jgi:predicted MFS family arabinose efflux permease